MPLIRKDAAATPAAPASASRLSTGSADERWAAARALAGRPEAVPELAAALAQEPEARVREAILTSLTRTGGPAAVDAVLPHLRSDEADLRTGALDALRAMAASVAPQVEALLGDPDEDVRILACEVVRQLPAADVDRLLAPVLETDPVVNVCASAVDVVAELGSADVVPALTTCAARFPDEAFLRFAIKAAIDRIGSQTPDARG